MKGSGSYGTYSRLASTSMKANAAPRWVPMCQAPASLRKQALLTSRQNEPGRNVVYCR